MTPSRIPGLKDVARVAGVSVTTVSRLLNGSLDLPSKTKKRIEDALKRQAEVHAKNINIQLLHPIRKGRFQRYRCGLTKD